MSSSLSLLSPRNIFGEGKKKATSCALVALMSELMSRAREVFFLFGGAVTASEIFFSLTAISVVESLLLWNSIMRFGYISEACNLRFLLREILLYLYILLMRRSYILILALI